MTGRATGGGGGGVGLPNVLPEPEELAETAGAVARSPPLSTPMTEAGCSCCCGCGWRCCGAGGSGPGSRLTATVPLRCCMLLRMEDAEVWLLLLLLLLLAAATGAALPVGGGEDKAAAGLGVAIGSNFGDAWMLPGPEGGDIWRAVFCNRSLICRSFWDSVSPGWASTICIICWVLGCAATAWYSANMLAACGLGVPEPAGLLPQLLTRLLLAC